MIALASQIIEQQWGLHEVSLKRVLTGYGSKGVYHIGAAEGEFVFKWHDASAEDTLRQSLALMDWLPSRGFPYVPRLRRCVNGENYGQFDQGLGYLYHFIPGTTPSPTPEHYAQLGEIIAALHQVTGYTQPVAWTIREIVGHITHDRAPHVPLAFRADYLQLAASLPAMDHLPYALMHGDIALVNTVKGPDGGFTLLDWSGAGIGVRIFDVAALFFQWLSADLTFDQASAQAFFRAYLARQPLTAEELAYLPALCLLLPLNFILFGDTAQKWQKILWLHQHGPAILRSLL